MTSGIFAFNEDSGKTVKSSIGTLMTDLTSTLSDLDNFVVKVKADWDGDEMETYNTTYTGWKKNAEQVKEILDGVGSAIGSVNEGVHEMRESVRSSLKEDG
jgi:uncharacterized protein YukE